MSDTTTSHTATIVITFSRDRLLFEHPETGAKVYTVTSDGPVRGRDLIWCEKASGAYRVIPANEFRNFTNSTD